MKEFRRFRRILAGLMLASIFMTIPTFATPIEVDGSLSAIRTEAVSDPISATEATAEISSPVTVTEEDASGSIQILYQDETGREITVTADVQTSEETSVAVDASQAVDTPQTPVETTYALVCTKGDSLRVRQGPGTDYDILGTIPNQSCFPIIETADGWYQISWNGQTGYICGTYAKEMTLDQIVALEEEAVASMETGEKAVESVICSAESVTIPAGYDEDLGQAIVEYALTYVGCSYVYGTAGPDTFDCSGFTSWVYNHFGYTLNRCSKDQLKDGVAVKKADLLPGDIVLFSRDGSVVTHVGLYIGDGQIVHASTSTTGVIISDLYSNYYVEHYYAARRII